MTARWLKIVLPLGAVGAAFLLPAEVLAQPVTGLYADGAGGATFNQGQMISPRVKIGTRGKELFDPGYMGKAAVGWGLGNGFRVEVEGNYRQSRLGGLQNGGFKAKTSGHQQNYGVMTNALFDMDVGARWIYPYFGAGIGYGWQTNNLNMTARNIGNARGDAGPNGFNEHIGGTSGGFAYQAMVGASLPVPWIVGLSTTVEYRFYTVAGHHSHYGVTTGSVPDPLTDAPNNEFTDATGRVRTRTFFNHSLMWGLRYEFNPPPPPSYVRSAAVMAPAPSEKKTYLIFFDQNATQLTPRAKEILETAAHASTATIDSEIQVRSYAQPLEAKEGDKKVADLNLHRAEAVAAELIRDGVPAGIIGVKANGKILHNPIEGEGSGGQNQKVEIDIQADAAICDTLRK